MKRWGITGAASAAMFLILQPMQAYAGSPEFAYTAEKWAALRDDKLEYDEIADLVHEYNNTVIQNQIAYKEEKDDDRDDVAQDYYDRANEIYDNITYPDSDDANYGSQMAAALQNEQQAEALMKQGDESTDDSETKKLGYDKTEAALVKQAQGLMITYWNQYYSLDSQREKKAQAEASYQSEQNRLAAGMSTQAKVLSAKEAVSTAEASILSGESSLEKTKESLCLMLGWTYGSDVEIGELPEPDMDRIAATDIDADIQAAVENNYTYRITKKQLANARTSTVKEKLTQTEKNQREAISTNVKAAYSSLILARSNYEQAIKALELEQTNMASAENKLQAGTITRTSYQNQQSVCLTAEVTVRTRKLDLLQALVDYDWAVGGLAAVS
ncbi:TolC family protein [Clostridium sp. AN503]|uniref:TolC family protein n=1 Tax=Clostridium sp. AN503 TaxID=3160598 RepID=UPI00345AADDC